jgi:hypothetical protein
MCGREAAVYDTTEEVRNGQVKKVMVRVGDKMKAESDIGYEPSLLCQMDKAFEDGDGNYTRTCHVIKERFGAIDSKTFKNPTFKDFLPHIELLNLEGEHVGVDTSRNSEALIESPDRSWNERRKQVDILLEELQGELALQSLAGTASDAQKKRTELMLEIFETASKTAIENLPLEQLRSGVTKIRARRLSQEASQELEAVNG